MKTRIFRTLLSTIAVLGLLAGLVPAAYADNSASASATFASRYVWRGLTASKSWVLQPSVDFVRGPVNVNYWANYDSDLTETNETDLTVKYTLPVESLTLSVGYIYYAFDGLDDTQEFFVSGSKAMDSITPYLNVYYDSEEGTGFFAIAGADYSKELTEKATLTLGLSASYQSENSIVGGTDENGEEYSALHTAEIKAAVAYKAAEGITVTPFAAYSTPLSSDSKDAIESFNTSIDEDNDSADVFYGGVSITMSF